MYTYHALINALSAHMIHVNLNMIFYTHILYTYVEHSPTKTICIKYYKKQNKKRTTNTHTVTVAETGLLLQFVLIPTVQAQICMGESC